MKKDTNYLKDKYPDIFAQIDIERTLQEYPGLDIDKLTCKSTKEIYFKCSKGHSCKHKIYEKVDHNIRCPICTNRRVLVGFNDFETYCIKNNRRDILDSWDYNKNSVKPSEITYGSSKKYYWKCPICGNESQLHIKDRLHSKCPVCRNKKVLSGYNDLKTWCIKNNREDILEEWIMKKILKIFQRLAQDLRTKRIFDAKMVMSIHKE